MRRPCLACAARDRAPPPSAQPRTAFPEKRGLKLSQFPRVIKLADNVYGYEEIRNPGMTTVSLFVVGRDGVLLVDGQGSVEATQKLLDAIAKTTPQADQVVRRRIRSRRSHGGQLGPAGGHHLHRHPDVAGADGARCRQCEAARRRQRPRRPPRARRRRPRAAGDRAADGDDRRQAGRSTSAASKRRCCFSDARTPAATCSVYLPKQKILFMSEAYLNRVFPAMRSAYPSEWVKAIDRALAMDVERYVPGHGFIEEPKASREELVEYQKALKYVIGEVAAPAQARALGGRRAQAGELGPVQGLDAGRSAGHHRDSQGLRRDRREAAIVADDPCAPDAGVDDRGRKARSPPAHRGSRAHAGDLPRLRRDGSGSGVGDPARRHAGRRGAAPDDRRVRARARGSRPGRDRHRRAQGVVVVDDCSHPAADEAVIDRIESSIHPVDRAATRIWFQFYPLALDEAMMRPDAADLARRMTLAGRWRLADDVDRSHAFLFGHRYWREARQAVLRSRGRSGRARQPGPGRPDTGGGPPSVRARCTRTCRS